jgi:tetratricopeptide (TPR) repeat protein/serine phosphatase RsbU (regulator of sigma subunit)
VNAAPDSLLSQYSKAPHDSVRIRILIEIGSWYKTRDTDSSVAVYNMAAKIAGKHLDDGNLYIFYTALAMRHAGTALLISGRNADAIDYFYKAIRYFRNVENDKSLRNNVLSGLSACYNNLGLIYFDNGMFDKSVEHFILSIQFDEGLGDSLGAAITYGNIGMVHYTMGNYHKAIEYYQKQHKTCLRYSDSLCITNALNNIGVSYKSMKMYDEALEFYWNTIDIRKRIGDRIAISATYNNVGEVYLLKQKYGEAEKYFKMALSLKIEQGDITGIILTYNNLAWLSIEVQKPDVAINYAAQAMELSMTSDYLPERINSYKYLTRAYLLKKDYEKAVVYSQMQLQATDSLFQMQKTRIMAEMESRFQSEKKQQEIEKQQLQLKKKEEEIMRRKSEARNQRNISIILTLVLLLVVLLAFFIYRSYREKKKTNILISDKNKQLELANAEISSQRDEIQAQRDLVGEQKEKIELIHKELTDSIRYARNIQHAVFPGTGSLEKIFGDYFLFFRPRDIVSGDFYWAASFDHYMVACVADCTGHGVPGAFMSMLGISALNEVVLGRKIIHPALILDEIRKMLVTALKQEQELPSDVMSISRVKDGMDVSLCVYDKQNSTITFSGAYNSCWIIPSEKCSAPEDLIELKGDKMPVGIHTKMHDFKEQSIPISRGSQVILLSDGFADQFGGEKNEKFKSKRLKELIFDLKDLKMVEQQIVLHEYFEEWKGKGRQTDDATILSFKV